MAGNSNQERLHTVTLLSRDVIHNVNKLVPLIHNEILKKQTVCSSTHWLCLHILDSNVDNVQNLSPRIPQWVKIFSEREFIYIFYKILIIKSCFMKLCSVLEQI